MEHLNLLGIVFCMMVGLFAIMVPSVISLRTFWNNSETIGVVMGFEEDGDSSWSVVRFTTQHGQEVTIRASGGYELGQRVTVRYPPDQPEKGLVKGDQMMSSMISIGFFLIFIIFVIFTLTIIWPLINIAGS